MKNAIVTGGTGFIGRNMVRRLCESGYAVYAVVRPDSPNLARLPEHPNVHAVCCPLDEIECALDSLPLAWDVLYHFAWGGVNRREIDDAAVHNANLKRSLEVLRVAVARGCGCFVDAGSRVEYGVQEGLFREDAPCRPLVAYGRAKLEFCERASALCKNTHTRFLHARIFSVYGPDDHPWSLIHTAVTRMLRNEPMDLSACTQHWNFMDVRDAADLLLTMFERRDRVPAGDNGIFNVATPDTRPLRVFVDEIHRLTHSHSDLRFGSFQQGVESALSIRPDMTKVMATFGWEPGIPFEEGIRHMISEFEGNHG